MSNERKDYRITLVATTSLVEAIDEWRRGQPDLPTRNEAIRRLVLQALEKDQTQ